MQTKFRLALVLPTLFATVPALALFPRAALAQSDGDYDDNQLPAPPPPPNDEVTSDDGAAPLDARPPERAPDRASFEERLSPYGRWVDTSEYGRVWIPDGVRQGWQPYTDGRWVDTDWGWSFASNVPWGWAAFHYGSWGFGADLGWYWVPGYNWSPAWVAWRWQGGYACWSPYAPYGFRFGNSWPGWVAVSRTHFTSPITRYAIPRGQVGPIVRAAQPVRGFASARAVAAGNSWRGGATAVGHAGGVAQRSWGAGSGARAAPATRSGNGYARSWKNNSTSYARGGSGNYAQGGGNHSYARGGGSNGSAHGGYAGGNGGYAHGGGYGGGAVSHGGGTSGFHGGGGGSHGGGGGGGSHGGGHR